MDGDKLCETTSQFDQYFGVVLPPLLALKFWTENFLDQIAPTMHQRASFWKEREGLQPLGYLMTLISPVDLMRLFIEYERGHLPKLIAVKATDITESVRVDWSSCA
jgi:hypothetical protein